MRSVLGRATAAAGAGVLCVGLLVTAEVPAQAGDLSPVTFDANGAWTWVAALGPQGAVQLVAYGASGGSFLDSDDDGYVAGGLGGSATATIEMNAGDTLHVFVGGAGEDGTDDGIAEGGSNGGGTSPQGGGGGGGGASDVRLNGTELTDRILVAGGGGGAGSGDPDPQAPPFNPQGGDGGGAAGSPGLANIAGGGGGGTQIIGGAGGTGDVSGAPGVAGVGGDAGEDCCFSGGGGGGGWFGGGGGGAGASGGGGGGGGSGYAHPDATEVTLTVGVHEGAGLVTITPIEAQSTPSPTPTTSASVNADVQTIVNTAGQPDAAELADSGASNAGNLAGFGMLLIAAGAAAMVGGRTLSRK